MAAIQFYLQQISARPVLSATRVTSAEVTEQARRAISAAEQPLWPYQVEPTYA